MVVLIAVHAWAPALRKPYSMALWARHLTFEWPSFVYALDILAWDWFFALSGLFAAPVFRGSQLANWIRYLLIASGALALAGLVGIVEGDMQIRNIGVVGYAGIFPCATLLIALLFWRTPKCDEVEPSH